MAGHGVCSNDGGPGRWLIAVITATTTTTGRVEGYGGSRGGFPKSTQCNSSGGGGGGPRIANNIAINSVTCRGGNMKCN